MVFIIHTADYPATYAADDLYRVEPNPAGGWDVYIDPPDDPIGPPIGDTMPELEN